eukprot:2418728-Amphidinium_carterae.2
MKDIKTQPWWQYEDDITMFNEHSLKEAMSKELSQLINKKSIRGRQPDTHTTTTSTCGSNKMGDITMTNQQWTKRHQVQVLRERLFTIHPQH